MTSILKTLSMTQNDLFRNSRSPESLPKKSSNWKVGIFSKATTKQSKTRGMERIAKTLFFYDSSMPLQARLCLGKTKNLHHAKKWHWASIRSTNLNLIPFPSRTGNEKGWSRLNSGSENRIRPKWTKDPLPPKALFCPGDSQKAWGFEPGKREWLHLWRRIGIGRSPSFPKKVRIWGIQGNRRPEATKWRSRHIRWPESDRACGSR